MSIARVLSEDTVAIGLSATDKRGIIDQMLDLLQRAGAFTDREAALSAVMEREGRMSTGMKHGIAVPHGKTSAVRAFAACVATSSAPVDFDSLDGEPARIFIMTLSPPEKSGPHLQFLAEVSQLFKSADKREALLEARTPAELMAVLRD